MMESGIWGWLRKTYIKVKQKDYLANADRVKDYCNKEFCNYSKVKLLLLYVFHMPLSRQHK